MSETQDTNETSKSKLNAQLTGLLQHAAGTINTANETAAIQRVAALRAKYPKATADELVEKLIRQKCLQTGAIGAVTSSASILPELGTFVALTFGLAADLSMTLRLQTELVLEIINVYQHELSLAEKHNLIMLITGLTFGSNQLIGKAGVELAEKAGVRLEEKALAKAIPFLGVAASAGINILATYVIGRRAQAYFQRGPEALADWPENARVLTGIDERKVGAWLVEATENVWRSTNGQVHTLAGALGGVGKAGGKQLVTGASKTGKAFTKLTHWVGHQSRPAMRQTRSLLTRFRHQPNADEV